MPFHSDFEIEATNTARSSKIADDAAARFGSEAFNLFSSKQFGSVADQFYVIGKVGLPPAADLINTGKGVLDAGVKKDAGSAEIKYSESGSVRIGTRNGINVYCKDASGEWDSTDGKTWTLKDTNRVWHGEVSIRDGNYVSRNSDSGVTCVRRPDGTTSRSITDAKGQMIEVTRDASGVAVRCQDSTGVWTSTDGKAWLNAATGKTSNSTARIDEFGQYQVGYNGKETVENRSRELTAVEAYENRLSKEYGVVFPKPGETVESYEKNLTLRPPTIKELECIERVLERDKQMDLKGLRLAFVQGSEKTDQDTLYGVHRGGRSEILLYPRNNVQIDGWTGLEGTLQHELVHHEQYKNWGEGHWNSHAPAQARQLMRDFGWTYDETSQNYRISDRDNKQWQYNKDSGKWDPVVSGRAEAGDNSISNSAMRDRARVKPSTNYFNFPWEMHAEAQSMYRFDRHQLFEQSRELYDLMKQYDQREINRKYGADPSGQPLRIRGAGGTIVPNTPGNRRAVEEMERGFSRTKAPMTAYAMRFECCSDCRFA